MPVEEHQGSVDAQATKIEVAGAARAEEGVRRLGGVAIELRELAEALDDGRRRHLLEFDRLDCRHRNRRAHAGAKLDTRTRDDDRFGLGACGRRLRHGGRRRDKADETCGREDRAAQWCAADGG